MSSDPFLGQLILFAGNFAPRGWALCDGQLLPISQYSALFSILGTMYGGDGRTTFALPDLRGRVPLHVGNGPGLSSYRQGERGGSERHTLTVAQLPSHAHGLNAAGGGGEAGAGGKGLAAEASVYSSAQPSAQLGAAAIANTGGGQPVDHRQPYLAINYIIALQGTFPSRS